jgi:RES domain-containing protein
MSAAGIPVFYAAFERDTAMQETIAHVKETGESRKVQICWGTFETKEPIQVLDLRRVPDKPGLFSIQRAKRPAIGFLRHFAEEIAKPIQIDGLEHIEYTPTQAVAEFFRHVHRTPAGDRVQGIIYPSAIADGTSCVLFFGAKHCCSLQDGWHKDSEHQLGLLPESIGSITFETKWVAM